MGSIKRKATALNNHLIIVKKTYKQEALNLQHALICY